MKEVGNDLRLFLCKSWNRRAELLTPVPQPIPPIPVVLYRERRLFNGTFMREKLVKNLFAVIIILLVITGGAVAKADAVMKESKDDSFSAEFPADVKEESFTYSGSEGIGYKYFAFLDGTSFYAFSYPKADVPQAGGTDSVSPWFVETIAQTEKVFEEFTVKTDVKQLGVFKVTFAQIIERPGESRTGVHRIMNVVVGDRLLSFRVVNRLGDDPKAGDRFFESIRVGAERSALLPKGSIPKVKKQIETDRNNGSGRGSGAGSGSGAGNGTGTENSTPSKGESRELKILSIGTTKYTTLGRYYRISGDVLLRVTFGSDGEISAITPVKGLAFGLTESAITTARNIDFEPKVENGKPVSSTKVVTFTFGL